MQLKETQLFDMAATIAAGIFANPSNGHLAFSQFEQQQIIENVLRALEQAIINTGSSITY